MEGISDISTEIVDIVVVHEEGEEGEEREEETLYTVTLEQAKIIMLSNITFHFNKAKKSSIKHQRAVCIKKMFDHVLLNFDVFYKIFSSHKLVDVFFRKCKEFINDNDFDFLTQTSTSLLEKLDEKMKLQN